MSSLFDISISKSKAEFMRVCKIRLSKYVDIGNSFLIEFGCGAGRFANMFSRMVKNYLGVDSDEGLIDIAKEIINRDNVGFEIGSMDSFSCEEKADIIAYPFSFWFSKDFGAVFENAYNLLKDDGVLFVLLKKQVPFGWSDSRLNKDSKNFNEKVYLKNVKRIAMAETFLRDNKYFEIVEEWHPKGDYFILEKNTEYSRL